MFKQRATLLLQLRKSQLSFPVLFFIFLFSSRFANLSHEGKSDVCIALSMYVDPHSNNVKTPSTVYILRHCLHNWSLLRRTHTCVVSGNKTGTSNRVSDGTPECGLLHGSVVLLY